MIKICVYCKKEFEIDETNGVTRRKIYCSKLCGEKYHRSFLKGCKCSICGNSRVPSAKLCRKCSYKHRRTYIGSNNPRWKGGNSAGYLLRICTEILIKDNRDLNQCERCKKDGKISMKGGLDIHHRDKNRDNNIVSNLMIVCKSCHKMLDTNPIRHLVRCHNCKNVFTMNESTFKRSIIHYCNHQCYFDMVGKYDYRKKVRKGGIIC